MVTRCYLVLTWKVVDETPLKNNGMAFIYFPRGLRDGVSWVTDVTGHEKWQDRTVFSSLLYLFKQSFCSSYFLPLFHYLITILLFPCASVWENTRAWVPIFYSHSEWNLLSSGTNALVWWRACYKTTKLQINKQSISKLSNDWDVFYSDHQGINN